MLLVKAFFLGLLLVAAFIYAQYVFDRHCVKSVDSFLDSVKNKWYYWPVLITPLVLLVLGSGWFLTP